MRVAHLIETLGPGGAETVYAEIAIGLARRGHASLPIVPGAGWIAETLRSAGVHHFIIPLGRAPDLAFLHRLDALVRRERVDVIHAHLLHSAAYASLVGRFRGLPVVATFHGAVDAGRPGWRRSVKVAAIRWGASRIVFVSRSLRDALAPVLAVPMQNTAIIPNGIDTTACVPGRNPVLRNQLGAEPDDILVGAMGNVRPAKDYATFLRAAALLAQRSPRWRFVIFGDTKQYSSLFADLERLRDELDLTQRLHFFGFHADVAGALHAIDVLVCSSSSEGFSLAVCQAMASGVPVVSTRCGGPEEILEDGVTGLLVGKGNAEQIANAVDRIASNRVLRDGIVVAARREVARRFSSETMVTAYERLYEDVLASRSNA